ncbi:MAG: phospholipase D-like domain-containing protein, partial [Candidatus Eisenbacteria bacterium]
HEIGCRVRSKGLARILSDVFELDWSLAEDVVCGPSEAKAPVNAVSESASAGSEATAEPPTPAIETARPAPAEPPSEASEATRPKLAPHPKTAGFALKQYELPLTGIARAAGTGRPDTFEVWPVYSPSGLIPDERLWDEPRLVSLIDGARSEVVVQLLSYSCLDNNEYYDVLDAALRRAAARRVSVKLLVSDWSKSHPAVDCLKSLEVLPNIEVRLSTIPEWSGGFVPYSRVEHCKYMVVDGKACWIGTSNWARSYFHTCRNVGLIIAGKSISETLRQVFQKSWDSKYAYPVRPELEYAPPKRDG